MSIEFKDVVARVGKYYQDKGLAVEKRTVGYGLGGYDFAETIDDGDIRLLIGASLKINALNIFVIGNAWGFSALCLAMIFPNARIDVIDAECEGDDVGFGSVVTNEIVKKYGLKVNLLKLESPGQVPMAAGNRKYDIGLVDGRHGDMQLVEDFLALVPHMRERNLILMPCVTYKKMERGVGVVGRVAKLLGYDFFEKAAGVTFGGTAIAGRLVSLNPDRAEDIKLKML